MTPNSLKLRVENSLGALKRYFHIEGLKPHISQLPTVQFVESDDGEILNFVYNGQLFYGSEGGRTVSDNQVRMFTNDKKCFHPPMALSLKEDEVFYKFAKDLDARFGAPHMFDPYRIESDDPFEIYDVPKGLAPTLMIFGMGLGYHIEPLIDAYDIGTLIILESDPVVFVSALAAQPWTRIVQKLKRRGVRFEIVFQPDGAVGCFQAMNVVRRGSQTNVVGVRVFAHYGAGQMGIAREIMPRVASMMGMAAGYFTDEFRQVKQARENLRTGTPALSRKAIALPDDHMALVIGAGPSLDASYDLIKAARSQVYVISCGTALEPLLKRGIEPDAHVELETHPSSILSYQRIAGLHIPVLLPVSFDPESATLFPARVFFLRDVSTSTQMFGGLGAEKVQDAFAITGNAGAALAIYLGFKHVMLLGMDCGYRPGDAAGRDFHASDTAYDDDAMQKRLAAAAFEGAEELRPELAEAITNPHGAASVVIDSVDGLPLLASPIYSFALSTYNKLVENNRDRRIYQICRGAQLRGATNALPEDMSIQGMRRSFDAADLVERCCPRDDLAEGYERNAAECAEIMRKFWKRAAPMFNCNIETEIDFIRADQAFIDLQEKFGEDGPQGAALSLLRVTSCTFAQAAFERALLILDPAERKRWLAMSWRVLGELVEHTVNQVVVTFAAGNLTGNLTESR